MLHKCYTKMYIFSFPRLLGLLNSLDYLQYQKLLFEKKEKKRNERKKEWKNGRIEE